MVDWLPTIAVSEPPIDFERARQLIHKEPAGEKLEGAGLPVRRCYFHHNENGILTSSVRGSHVLVENCEFNHNGNGEGKTHNIYIGHVDSFTARGNYFHNANRGQEIKSRAYLNYILYNRITCEENGRSNYEIDISDGGTTYIIGNLIHQGPLTDNTKIIAYAAESDSNPDQHLYVVNNTIVNTCRTIAN